MKDKEKKDNLTDLVEALPEIGNDPEIPPGVVRAEDDTFVTLHSKPGEPFFFSITRKDSNSGKKE